MTCPHGERKASRKAIAAAAQLARSEPQSPTGARPANCTPAPLRTAELAARISAYSPNNNRNITTATTTTATAAAATTAQAQSNAQERDLNAPASSRSGARESPPEVYLARALGDSLGCATHKLSILPSRRVASRAAIWRSLLRAQKPPVGSSAPCSAPLPDCATGRPARNANGRLSRPDRLDSSPLDGGRSSLRWRSANNINWRPAFHGCERCRRRACHFASSLAVDMGNCADQALRLAQHNAQSS
jgi:hypothetical protein